MAPNLAVIAALAFLLASGPLAAPHRAALPTRPPDPAHCDQWQPQTDPSDTRLDAAFVSVWEPQITVGDLLARISDQSSVQLSAEDAFLASPLTVFADGRMLSGVMVALAALCDGRWVFERGQPPTQRAYHLVRSPSPVPALDRLFDDMFLYLTGVSLEERRARFPHRLAAYRAALPLSPDEILARYEHDDPSLCAALLNPGTRATAEILCQLDQDAIHDLLYHGLAHVNLGDLSPALKEQFRSSAAGVWADLEGASPSPDPSRPPDAEEPFDHTPVNLRWNGSDVQLYLGTPEHHTSTFGTLQMADDYPPYESRSRLIDLGYLADTPERRAAIEAESRAWEAAEEEKAEQLGLLDLEEYFRSATDQLLGRPNQTDPRLDVSLALPSLDRDSLAATSLLEQAARQCPIAVIADEPPLAGRALSPDELADQPTLRSILSAIRAWHGDGFSWSFHGHYLVARGPEQAAVRVLYPGDPVAWLRGSHPVAFNALDDIASIIALGASISY